MVDLPASKSNNIISNRQTTDIVKPKHKDYIGTQPKGPFNTPNYSLQK